MIKIHYGSEGLRDGNNELIVGGLIRTALVSQNVSIGNTATPIPATATSNRLSVLIMNIGTVEVFIGGSDVTANNGFPVYPRATLLLQVEDKAVIYGIVATGTQNIRIIEGY